MRSATRLDPRRPTPLDPHRFEMLLELEQESGEGFLAQVLGLYIAGAPRLLREMRQAIASGSAEGLAVAAHSLKSSSGNLGATELAGLCRDLEAMGRGGYTEGALELWQDAVGAFAEVRFAIREWPGIAA